MLINVRNFLSDPFPYYYMRFRTLLADPLPSICAYVLGSMPPYIYVLLNQNYLNHRFEQKIT